MIIDRLFDNVSKNGCVCLGLDTSPAYIPEDFSRGFATDADAVFAFNKKIIDATADVVACYKAQIAYYEALGLAGLEAYKKTLAYVKSVGQISIADVKRGDISATAEMYARAHFTGDFEADFVTLNPYLGLDSLEPYERYFASGEKGCFVLLRTSNPGAKDIQYLDTADGRKVYEVVAEKIQSFGEKYIGARGYSAVGAVMGATNREEGRRLREMCGTTFLLIPGFGAQGGTAGDVALYLQDGNGGVANSSRGILTAYKKIDGGGEKFAECARTEAVEMNEKIRGAVNENHFEPR